MKPYVWSILYLSGLWFYTWIYTLMTNFYKLCICDLLNVISGPWTSVQNTKLYICSGTFHCLFVYFLSAGFFLFSLLGGFCLLLVFRFFYFTFYPSFTFLLCSDFKFFLTLNLSNGIFSMFVSDWVFVHSDLFVPLNSRLQMNSIFL